MALPAPLELLDENAMIGMLKFEERVPVRRWQDILQRFDAAPNKGAAIIELRREYGEAVKLSQSTLYNKLKRYRTEGLVSLFPARARKRLLKQRAVPNAFVVWFRTLALDSQRACGSAAAIRSLFTDHLCAGEVIPGYDTDWRGIWRRDHPNGQPPATCPYAEGRVFPDGWSTRSLYRLLPDEYGRVAARIGTKAGRELLPKLPSTRVGLRVASVFVADDRHHDAMVKFAGNVGAHGVVELGALELLTAHYCTWGAKPIREKTDGTREYLREVFMRYLIADILCHVGYDPMGCKVIGESGTARLPEEVQRLIAKLTLNKVEFVTGAILNAPIAKGLMPGEARGNYRMKAALESAHARYKNDMGLLPGQKGADPEHAPEDLESKRSYHRSLMKACIALAHDNADLVQHVATPFPEYYSYLNAVGLVYQRIANDPNHSLEGFSECGFVVPEFLLPGFAAPQPIATLEHMEPEDRALYDALIRRDPRRQVNRLMSRREAFDYMQQRSELMRLPDSCVPEILGPQLGDVLTVTREGEFVVPDKYIAGKRYQVAAICVLPSGVHQSLDRGTRWLVHLNTLNATEAFVSTPDGVYVGKAPVLTPGTKYDFSHKNLSILTEMESAQLKRLAPTAEKRLRARAEMAERNVALLTGRDPLADIDQAATDAEHAAQARRHLDPASLVDHDNPSDDEPIAATAFSPTALLG